MFDVQEIWKRIEYERDKPYALFGIYRNDGPTRSHQKVKVKWKENSGEDISISQIETYSTKYNWVERASAYDDFLDEQELKKNWKAIEEMNKRQAEDAKLVQSKALEDLEEIDCLEEGSSKASPEGRRNAAARTWEIGVRNERLARGAATEHIEQSGKVKSETNNGMKEFARVLQESRKAAKDGGSR